MTVVEFQISVEAFLAAQRTALKTMQFCAPAPIPVGPIGPLPQVQVVIDRIEFGDSSLRHNLGAEYSIYYDYLGTPTLLPPIPAFRTQIAQTVTVYVTAFNEVLANPNGSPKIVVPFQGTIVMDLQFYGGEPPDQNCYLATWFSNFEPGPLPFLPPDFDPKQIPLPIKVDDLMQMVTRYLSSIIPPQTVPFDLLDWLPVRPSKFLIVNAGVSADTQLQRLAFRVEIGPPTINPDVPWQNFYAGFIADRLGGADWGLFFEGDYIASVVQTLIYEGVSGALPDQLQLYVTTSYSNAGGKAVIMNDVLGIYDLPDPFGTLESNPHIPIVVSLAAADLLAIDVDIPNIKDLIMSFVPEWAKIFLRFSGPLGAFLQAMIDSAISSIKVPSVPPVCSWTSPNVLRCVKSFYPPGIDLVASPRLTGLLALDDGIALTGPMNITPYTTGDLALTRNEFQFRPPNFACSSAGPEIVAAFSNSPGDFDILHAEVIVDYGGTLPAYICAVTPINDPLGVFPAGAISWNPTQATSVITVHPPVPPQAYYDAPYTCDLLVRTTVGVRVVRIPPPPHLTHADVDRLVADMVVKLGNCEKLVDSWFKLHQGYNPAWGVDPYRVEDVIHLWEIEIQGVEPGGTVTIADSYGREIAKASARTDELVRLSALLPPSGARELAILHGGPGGTSGTRSEPSGLGKQTMSIMQRLLFRTGRIQLAQPCVGTQVALLTRKPSVVAVTENGATAFDFTNAKIPRRLAFWGMQGAKGALRWREGLILYGEEGLRMVDNEGRIVTVTEECQAEGVVTAAAGSQLVYAASSREIGVYSPRLCKLGAVQAQDIRSLVQVGGRLVAAGPRGLAVYDLSDPGRPALEAMHEMGRVSRLTRPLAGEPASFLALSDDGSAKLMRLATRKGQLEELAKFPRAPWFADAVRLGNTLVTIGEDGSSLEIGRFGPSNRA
ncbi:MAG TPA: hypothetical protein VLY21_00700 [Nitrososphaerales archaeon]|nr:hypothetical protein [Nitrososphaerales archaeon]